jgi:hypothetical protein
MHMQTQTQRSRPLIRKRLLQPIPHLLTQITIIIFHIRLVPRLRQLLQLLRQRRALRATTIHIDKYHDGEGKTNKNGQEPKSLLNVSIYSYTKSQ